jgi:hypothetical protein
METTSRILGIFTRWRWVVSFTPRPLYTQGKSPWYPLDRRLGGWSAHGGEEKNSQPLPWLEPPIIQPVAQCGKTLLKKGASSSWVQALCRHVIKRKRDRVKIAREVKIKCHWTDLSQAGDYVHWDTVTLTRRIIYSGTRCNYLGTSRTTSFVWTLELPFIFLVHEFGFAVHSLPTETGSSGSL